MVSVPLLCYELHHPQLLHQCWFPLLGWSLPHGVALGRVWFQRCSWHLWIVCSTSATLGWASADLVAMAPPESRTASGFEHNSEEPAPGQQAQPAWGPGRLGSHSSFLPQSWSEAELISLSTSGAEQMLSRSGGRMVLVLELTGLT